MPGIPKHVLVMGPSGVGKTHMTGYLREKGVNAVDADHIPGLAGYFKNGVEVECPPDADKEFLDNHEFLWRRDVLEKYLNNQDEVYVFGMSGNAFELLDLFDKVYFLTAPQKVLKDRLRHESRENPMGKTDFQLQNALEWASEITEEAKRRGLPLIDATLPPEKIFEALDRV